MRPQHIKQLQHRSRDLRVGRVNETTFAVDSATDPDQRYIVKLVPDRKGRIHSSCTCTWGRFKGVACSHVMATLNHVAEQKGRKLSFWENEEDAKRQKNRIFELAGSNNADYVWITSRAS